ncbi:hypothetical protein SUGI_0413960 [Cryptomeria japonica]|nr:hypothetical protein SUGI_0413960 [Cryptomeria japonica]
MLERGNQVLHNHGLVEDNFVLHLIASIEHLRFCARWAGAHIMPSTKRHHKLDHFYFFLCIRFSLAVFTAEPEIVVLSGGHSYEGLSSTSDAPNFAIIDLINLDRVTVDMKSKTAWAEAGATVGQLYSAIAGVTTDYGFPAGVCPTMGTGGHFSGGGLSLLSRKYGLAANNIIDALLVDANGNLLDRKKMGEDLFWAIRGGGGGSWGVVIAWKVRLVRVPRKVTVFNVHRTGRNQVTDLVHRWQSIAPYFEQDLFIRAVISGTQLQSGQKDIKLTFNGMYLGPLDQLLKLAKKSFPEMGIVAGECEEKSWMGSISCTAFTTTS